MTARRSTEAAEDDDPKTVVNKRIRARPKESRSSPEAFAVRTTRVPADHPAAGRPPSGRRPEPARAGRADSTELVQHQ